MKYKVALYIAKYIVFGLVIKISRPGEISGGGECQQGGIQHAKPRKKSCDLRRSRHALLSVCGTQAIEKTTNTARLSPPQDPRKPSKLGTGSPAQAELCVWARALKINPRALSQRKRATREGVAAYIAREHPTPDRDEKQNTTSAPSYHPTIPPSPKANQTPPVPLVW